MELGQIAIRPDETADIVRERKFDRRGSIVRTVMVTSPIQPLFVYCLREQPKGDAGW